MRVACSDVVGRAVDGAAAVRNFKLSSSSRFGDGFGDCANGIFVGVAIGVVGVVGLIGDADTAFGIPEPVDDRSLASFASLPSPPSGAVIVFRRGDIPPCAGGFVPLDAGVSAN